MNYGLKGFFLPRTKKRKKNSYTGYAIIISISLIVLFIIYKLSIISKEISLYQKDNRNTKDAINNKIEEMNIIKDNIYAMKNDISQFQKENKDIQNKIDKLSSDNVALNDKINGAYTIIEVLTLSSGIAVMKYKKLQEESNILQQKKEVLNQSFGLLIIARNNLRLQFQRYSDELLDKEWKN